MTDAAAVPFVAPVPFVVRAPGAPPGHPFPSDDGAGAGAPQFRVASGVAQIDRGVDFGPLASVLADPDVTDVFVNGPRQLWVDRGDGLRPHPLELDETQVRELATRLVWAGGRHVDEASPVVDARLPGGVRVHVVLPPVSPAGTLISIRVPPPAALSLTDLDGRGFFVDVPLDRILSLVSARTNLLITGAGGSGKTTLLSALLGAASDGERIVAVEDVAELRPRHPQFISLEARQANLEGAGAIGLARLVRESLRMRPDRLVLGECRGEEIRELLSALNTGHDGGAGTLHANSLDDVPARLEALGALAGLDPQAIARQAVSAIGAVLHVERVGGVRRLAGIARLALDEAGRLAVVS